MKMFGGKPELTPGQQRGWNTLLFLLRLLALSIPLYIILMFGVDLYPLQLIVAASSSWILNLLGFGVMQNGALLTVEGAKPFVFFLDADCTGWKSMLLLFALIFAVPKSSLKKRGVGLLIGIPIVWIGNLARVVGTVLIERAHGLETATAVHDYLWQFGLIFLVLILWVFWLWRIR